MHKNTRPFWSGPELSSVSLLQILIPHLISNPLREIRKGFIRFRPFSGGQRGPPRSKGFSSNGRSYKAVLFTISYYLSVGEIERSSHNTLCATGVVSFSSLFRGINYILFRVTRWCTVVIRSVREFVFFY